MGTITLRPPYLIFLGDVDDELDAKPAFGMAHFRPEACVGQLRLDGCRLDLGLPDRSPQEAADAGARSMLWGAATVGGEVPASWIAPLFDAVDAGLDLVAGTHTPLSSIDGLAAAAEARGVRLVDVRRPPPGLPVGNGRKRRGKRLLTVGTDCAVGKKFTALALAEELARRGVPADFRATGQTGIMIAGGGIPIDAVVADFVSGAAEVLSPDNHDDHWDVIEGQGALHHPAYGAVTLGLLHGSQPDAFVVCHAAGRTQLGAYPAFKVPELSDVIAQTIAMGRVTNPQIRCVGVSVHTGGLSDAERRAVLDAAGSAVGLPCVDAIATGVAPIIDALLRSDGGGS